VEYKALFFMLGEIKWAPLIKHHFSQVAGVQRNVFSLSNEYEAFSPTV
jgi:hypothetical protein